MSKKKRFKKEKTIVAPLQSILNVSRYFAPIHSNIYQDFIDRQQCLKAL
jgi:hypothetical protein